MTSSIFQERESDHLASLEDLNTKHLKAVLVNEKLISDNKELNDQIKEFTEREEQRLVVEMEASSTGKPTEPSPDEVCVSYSLGLKESKNRVSNNRFSDFTYGVIRCGNQRCCIRFCTTMV